MMTLKFIHAELLEASHDDSGLPRVRLVDASAALIYRLNGEMVSIVSPLTSPDRTPGDLKTK